MTEHEPFPHPPEKKEFKVDFAFLAENEPEWLILASQGGDKELVNRMRDFVINSLGVNYIQVEKPLLGPFLSALAQHRNKNWHDVETNLQEFYSAIDRSTGLSFDPNVVAKEETAIWKLMDRNLTGYVTRGAMAMHVGIMYSNLLGFEIMKLDKEQLDTFIHACKKRAYALDHLKKLKHSGTIDKIFKKRQIKKDIKEFWLSLDQIINYK